MVRKITNTSKSSKEEITMKKLLTVVLCALMVFGSVVSVAPTTALAKSKCSHKRLKWVTLVKLIVHKKVNELKCALIAEKL